LTKLSHQLLGVSGSLLVLSLTANPLYSLFFYLGNAFPDIDVFWNDFSSYKTKWYSHRGITHSLLVPIFLLLLTGAFYLIGESSAPYLLSFSAGILFHDLCDAMSPTGIPLKLSYYPRFKLWTLYRNRHWSEATVVLLTALCLLTASVITAVRYKTVDRVISKCYYSVIEQLLGGQQWDTRLFTRPTK